MTAETGNDWKIDEVAIRGFRDTGDADYIVARMAFRAALPDPALWSSLQAIEKYLKSALLLQRIPAIEVQHDLLGALKLVKSAFPSFYLTPASDSTIESLNTEGPDRYFLRSKFNSNRELIMVDRTVWELRRLCVRNHEERQILLKLKLKNREVVPKYSLKGGLLEAILADKSNPARQHLIWNNAFIGTRSRKTVAMTTWIKGKNTPLSMYPEIFEEVAKYIYFPKLYKKAFRNDTKPA